MAYRISVDTGGTFTDIVVSEAGRIVLIEKALTTPERIFRGMRAAMEIAAERLKLGLAELLADTELLIYGTTRSTNAIVERKTAKTALLVTGGFPDILLYREGGKAKPHDSSKDYPAPYIPRRHTFEVIERISAEGDVLTPLDVEQATGVMQELKARGFEAVAVCFLWSVVNPAHELAVAELLQKHLPDVPFTLSHKLIPIVREYRRASATAIDASLKPLMGRHLREMEHDLRAAGFHGEILVSTSVGGCMGVDELAERPIHTLKSGPAMAPIAGRYYAAIEDAGNNVIVCDTGGTTFDVGLIRDGNIVYSRDTWLGGKWTGHIMSMSTVDMRSIGAGGGSIAHVDAGGLLKVGPRSAGSVPGPACYGRGGVEPTVTDAALVLGYLDPHYFLGGRMKLSQSAAEAALDGLAAKIGTSREDAAYAVINLANEHMIAAIQEITVNEGINPRESLILAGGGAAGMNIGLIAQELGCERVLLPGTASALSASGMQFSDIVFEHSASGLTRTNEFDFAVANKALSAVKAELDRFVADLGERAAAGVRMEFFVEARYLFQVWELEVPLTFESLNSDDDVQALVAGFDKVHERVFAVIDKGSPVECVTWKGRVIASLGGGIPRPLTQPEKGARPEPQRRRQAYFGGGNWADTPIHQGQSLAAGAEVEGPAVIEEP
ncbi:MAG: hydantoinase/oxoprolinase family protein, partial [Rhizobiaceae bacterium]|nr:hydantoinase/oxoprolinase family protein [Rhizobiaceae bacterium]